MRIPTSVSRLYPRNSAARWLPYSTYPSRSSARTHMGISSPACSANMDCDSKTGFMAKCVLWSIVELETLNCKPIQEL